MNAIKIILIILFILLTAFACAINPKMHKPVVVTDLNYRIEEQQPQGQKTTTQTPKYSVEPVIQQVKTTQQPQQKVIVQVIEEHIQSSPKTVQTQTPAVKTVTQTVNQPAVTNQNQELLQRVLKNTESNQQTPVKTVKENTQPVKVVEKPKTPVKTVTVNTTPLTEEEEIIAWNKWRSDLQNQVMRDSNISAPYGTTFNFSFTVDKNGNVSNINTWSVDNNYTPLAKRVIKPILTSYQHTAILKFPERTKRTIVNVTGGFTISNVDRYSTPADYSDYERIYR